MQADAEFQYTADLAVALTRRRTSHVWRDTRRTRHQKKCHLRSSAEAHVQRVVKSIDVLTVPVVTSNADEKNHVRDRVHLSFLFLMENMQHGRANRPSAIQNYDFGKTNIIFL